MDNPAKRSEVAVFAVDERNTLHQKFINKADSYSNLKVICMSHVPWSSLHMAQQLQRINADVQAEDVQLDVFSQEQIQAIITAQQNSRSLSEFSVKHNDAIVELIARRGYKRLRSNLHEVFKIIEAVHLKYGPLATPVNVGSFMKHRMFQSLNPHDVHVLRAVVLADRAKTSGSFTLKEVLHVINAC